MNKRLIPVLLILAGLAACKGKGDTGMSDSTSAPKSVAGNRGDINSTLKIIPPSAADQPIQVTTQAGLPQDSVSFTGVFSGTNPQTVNIVVPGGANASFTNVKPTWGPFIVVAPANPQNIIVTVSVMPPPYNNVTNVPTDNPNMTGQLVSTYTDGTGSSSQIMVKDVSTHVQVGKK